MVVCGPACSTSQRGGPGGGGAVGTDRGTRRALEEIAARQASGARSALVVPPPPGIDPGSVAPIETEDQAARRGLEATATELAAVAPRAAPSPKPNELSRRTALHVYASGRLALLRGDLQAARNDLQTATRLDPDAVEPWEAYGEALLRSGQVGPAIESLSRAVERGSTDPLTLLTVARDAQQRGDHQRAAAVLVAMRNSPSMAGDLALPYVVSAMLGESLVKSGRLSAAQECLAVAADLPEQFNHPTRFREELADVYRHRADLWRAIGDVSCRLGRYEEAREAYDRAAGIPSLDPGATLARRVYADLRTGRGGAGALAVLDEMSSPDGRVEERHIPIIRYLVAHAPEVGPMLGRAIEEARSARSEPEAASIAGRRARAAAAAFPVRDPRPAREVLRRRLAECPTDEAAIGDLLGTYAGAESREVAAELSRLVERAPGTARSLADAALRQRSRTYGPLADALRSGRLSAAGRVLLSALAERAGDERAGFELEQAVQAGKGSPDAAAAVVSVAAALGRWDLAEQGIVVLSGTGNGDEWRTDWASQNWLARSLVQVQRFDEAWQCVSAAIAAEDRAASATVGAADLRLAADLAIATGHAREGEGYLRRAIEADPYVESPYLGLISLYAGGGALADQNRLFETIRAAREAIGSGRGLRLLRAQEMAGAGQLAQAEPELLDLAQDDPRDGAPIRVLIAIWDNQAKRGPGESPLPGRGRERMQAIADSDPGAPWPLLALARLEAHSDRQGAIEHLKAAVGAALPAEAETLSAGLEDLLRILGRADEADQHALARLRSGRPTIPNTVALAAVLARTGQVDEAGSVFSGRLPAGAMLDSQQLGALAEAVQSVARAAAPGAVTVARTLGAADPTPDPGLYRLWAQAIAQGGTPDDAIEFVRSAQARGMVEPVLTALLSGSRRADSRLTAAELAYTMGGVLVSRGSEADAIPLNELALTYDPEHAMAANDLGYTLLEQGRDLEKAERLLESAHRSLPEDANITDSIGWLRYKRGVLADETDAAGRVRQGAVSLLRRAVEQMSRNGDGTIIDHLGDALWASGNHEEAKNQWRVANRRAQELLSAANSRGSPDSPAAQRLKGLVDSTNKKQRAVLQGREPAIAPQLTTAAPEPSRPPGDR